MKSTSLILPDIADGEDKTNLLANVLRNHYRHLRKWAKRTECDAFRLYDREVKSFPVAIDFYAGRFCVHYYAPSKESLEPSEELRKNVAHAIRLIFGQGDETIFWRTRVRSKLSRQYEKRDELKEFFVVREWGANFWVNLTDYLDTGLFLDHRESRSYIASHAKGKRLLNLFAYTGAFSVHAAIRGASFTKSVDLSNTYCDWCQDNFRLNNIPLDTNEVVRADCLKFLPQEIRSGLKYDLIVIDPPTISRSKKMDELFDIQVDYVPLLLQAEKLLLPGGEIFFSTNSRKFTFDISLFPHLKITELTDRMAPVDFPATKLHRSWKLYRDVTRL